MRWVEGSHPRTDQLRHTKWTPAGAGKDRGSEVDTLSLKRLQYHLYKHFPNPTLHLVKTPVRRRGTVISNVPEFKPECWRNHNIEATRIKFLPTT